MAGYITGLGRDPDYLEFKLTGTQTERLVEVLSEPSQRIMQLHICPKDCTHWRRGPTFCMPPVSGRLVSGSCHGIQCLRR